jgi:acetyltransferase-like isoleucine patch superfamily enzyme
MPTRTRRIAATFARRPIAPDPPFEREHAAHLRETTSVEERLAIYDRFRHGQTRFDAEMRRILLRALVRSLGDDVTVGPGVGFLHPETFEIGDGVFLGAGAYIQGRFDGRCAIGRRTWIGPGAYLDARDLVIEPFVGWGPGAKVLGSEHTGDPLDAPVIETDLVIASVLIEEGADVGTNAVVLPGVTVGRSAIVGAGAVVSRDVEASSIVAGVPARPLRSRNQPRAERNKQAAAREE